MTLPPGEPFTVTLLADRPDLVTAVGALRWREWGHAPEPEDRGFWERTTRQEAGRDHLPVTFVAVGSDRDAVGAVGLGQYDLDDLRHVSPWVMGTVVRPDRRHRGVGRALMAALEAWAAGRGIDQVWVATERAAGFYRRCGWRQVETVRLRNGRAATVLSKRPTPGSAGGVPRAAMLAPDGTIPSRHSGAEGSRR